MSKLFNTPLRIFVTPTNTYSSVILLFRLIQEKWAQMPWTLAYRPRRQTIHPVIYIWGILFCEIWLLWHKKIPQNMATNSWFIFNENKSQIKRNTQHTHTHSQLNKKQRPTTKVKTPAYVKGVKNRRLILKTWKKRRRFFRVAKN